MDNILVYETGDCGSIPYKGTKFRIVTANLIKLFFIRKPKRCYPVLFCSLSIMVILRFCSPAIRVRFLEGAPSLDVIVGTSGHKLLVHDMFRA